MQLSPSRASGRSRPESAFANAMILVSLPRIRRCQCTRWRARESCGAALPVGYLCLRLARIHRQIFWPRVLAYDHSFVNVFLRPDEKLAARLDIVERVSSADSIFHRHHHSTTASSDFTFERRVFPKEIAHQSFAAGQVDEIGLEADQAARGDDRFNRNARRVMIHSENLAFAIGNRLQNVTEIFVR